MATRSLNVVITGDSKGIGVAAREADGHLKVIQRSAKVTGQALKIGFGAAAAGAAIGLDFLKKSVDAAKVAQESQKRLETQLKASGIAYRAHAARIDEVIKKQAELSAFAEHDLKDAFTTLVRATGSVTVSMRDLGLATDIARAKHLDITKAAEALGKVQAGNIGVLKRWGIAMDPVTAAQDKLKASIQRQVQALEAQAKTVTGTAKTAIEGRIQALRNESAGELKAAKATDKTATSQAALASLQKHFAGQAKAYGDTAAGAQDKFRNAVEKLQEKIGGALLPIITKVTTKVTKFVDDLTSGKQSSDKFTGSLDSLTTAIGPYAKATENAIGWASKQRLVIDAILSPIKQLINNMRGLKVIFDAVKSAAGAVAGAIGKIGKAASGIGGALKSAGGFIKSALHGDGIGQVTASGPLPSGGAFGGDLKGARPSLRPFAAVGSQFGLHVTDGKRPAGTKTVSGGVSYHSTGEAIDLGDGRGPDQQKLGFFKYMKSRFGARLAELIYTPGGAGIKDGRPFNYTGAVAAEHYDHVHVAFDTGAPGVGDGYGRMPGRKTGTGDGIGFTGAARLAESVGLPGITFAQIAHGESDYRPGAIGHDPGGTTGLGLWQITTGYNDDIIAKYGGQKAMLNAHTNALAARDVWRRQGRAAWLGTKYVTGWDLHYKGKLPKSKGGKGKDPKEGQETGPFSAGGLSSPPGSRPSAPPADSPTVQFGQAQHAPLKGRPAGPRKGNTPDQQAFYASLGQGDDPGQALIDSNTALAQALKDVKASIDAQTAFATSVSNTSNYQLTKTLADLIGGRIVGYGVAGRAFTPGTGVEYAY